MKNRPTIVEELHRRQKHNNGYLSVADLRGAADVTGQPRYRVNELVSFYPHFKTTPPPPVQIKICRDMSCHLNGSLKLKEKIQESAATLGADQVEVCGVSCLGRCDRSIAATVNENLVVSATEERLLSAARDELDGRPCQYDTDRVHAAASNQSWEIDIYAGEEDRYQIARRFAQNTASEVVDALKTAGLLGMGGAGGRAYRKWNDVIESKSPTGEKFIICNADESEPGTFKDRDLLITVPHLIIEGMIVAAQVTGAQQGWIYVRHEYHEQIESCNQEIVRANQVLSEIGMSFRLSVFESPGGYICGEQTALVEAMENKRAEPRIRPPELATNGLYNQPTLLSNVETFAWVPRILTDDGRWFQMQGKKPTWLKATHRDGTPMKHKVTGKRFFSISGDVRRPGVYEVETGITLGELIDDCCAGMRDNLSIQAVALSGPSGGVLPERIPVSAFKDKFVQEFPHQNDGTISVRDLPLDINISGFAGYMVGAGIVVYGSSCNLLDEVVANSRFFRNETCGKCVPCRIGSHKITELAERLQAQEMTQAELATTADLVEELSGAMQETSICGLGKVASNPFASFLAHFPDLCNDSCTKERSNG